MTNEKPLAERLSVDETKLFLDGNLIFETPETLGATREINIIGVYEDMREHEEKREIILGTGRCCFGYIIRLEQQREKFRLGFLTPIDFNVYDLLPVQIERPANEGMPKFPTQALAAGYGCCGQGVRLVNLHSPRIDMVVSDKEYTELMEKIKHEFFGQNYIPKFRIENQGVFLDIIKGYYDDTRLSSLRYPTFQPQGTAASIDLSDRLKQHKVDCKWRTLGIDFEATLEAAKKYQVQRR